MEELREIKEIILDLEGFKISGVATIKCYADNMVSYYVSSNGYNVEVSLMSDDSFCNTEFVNDLLNKKRIKYVSVRVWEIEENNVVYSSHHRPILDESLITLYNLNDKEVYGIVNEWYTRGLYPDILQNESGHDLEEICEMFIYNDVLLTDDR